MRRKGLSPLHMRRKDPLPRQKQGYRLGEAEEKKRGRDHSDGKGSSEEVQLSGASSPENQGWDGAFTIDS